MPYPPAEIQEYPVPIYLRGFTEIKLPDEIRGRHPQLVTEDDYRMIWLGIKFNYKGQCRISLSTDDGFMMQAEVIKDKGKWVLGKTLYAIIE